MRIDAFEREMAILDHAAELAAAKKSGKTEGKDESRAAIMKKLNKNAEEAMDFLEIPPEEHSRLIKLL